MKTTKKGEQTPLYKSKHITSPEYKLTPDLCYPKSNKPSMTVRGHSYTISELLERHTMGMPLNLKPDYEGYADNLNDPDINKSLSGDIYDVDQFKKKQEAKLKELHTKYEDERSGASKGGLDTK